MSTRISVNMRGPTGAPVVAVGSLTGRFDDLVIVDGISFDIADRKILGITGPNGAEKITLMECLEGLRHRTLGATRASGTDPDVADRS